MFYFELHVWSYLPSNTTKRIKAYYLFAFLHIFKNHLSRIDKNEWLHTYLEFGIVKKKLMPTLRTKIMENQYTFCLKKQEICLQVAYSIAQKAYHGCVKPLRLLGSAMFCKLMVSLLR